MTGLSELALAQPLLIIAIVAILLASAGWMIERERPRFALALRRSGYLGMLATALLLIGQAANEAEHSDAKLILGQHPSLVVEGTSTVVPMASDGHFWVTAKV
ncbi:MAG TPA: TIGR02281 family clan AA aspartic protease, partial [Novosphingobium sp.]|nr:TIGR02281 family clan AA aspartic protease [Novosphingobium sp.]